MLKYLLFLFAFSCHSASSPTTGPDVVKNLIGNSVDARDGTLTNVTSQFNPHKQMHRAFRRTRLSDWCSDDQKEIIREHLREVHSWAQMAFHATRHPAREGQPRDNMGEITLNQVFDGIPRHNWRAREAIGRRYIYIMEEIDNEGYGKTAISCNYNHPRSDCGGPGGPIIHTDIVRGGLVLVCQVAVSFPDTYNRCV